MSPCATEERGEGPAVVLVHGWNGFKEGWGGLPRALAEGGMRAVAVDLPGTGASPRPRRGPHDPQALARAVAAVAREREAVALVGHSLGVQVAMLAAAEDPAWPPRLALIAPFVQPRPRRIPPRRVSELLMVPVVGPPLAALAIAWLRRSPRRRREAFLSAVADPSRCADDPAMALLVDQASARLAAADLWGLVRWAAAALPLDMLPLAPRLRGPALVVSGAHDRVSPPAGAEGLARALPSGRLLRVPDAAHFPHLESPDRVLPAIVSHVRGAAPAA